MTVTVQYIYNEKFKSKLWSSANRYWEFSVLTIRLLLYRGVTSPSHIPFGCRLAIREKSVSMHCRTKEDRKQGYGQNHNMGIEDVYFGAKFMPDWV